MAIDTIGHTSRLALGRWDQDGNPVDHEGRTVRGPRVVHLGSPEHEEHIRQAREWGLQLLIGRMDVYKFDTADLEKYGVKCEPYEIVRGFNAITNGGGSCLWECLIGNGTGTAAQTLTFFNNGNAAIGTGDSNTAYAATQTDLQATAGTTHQLRKAMVATYPLHVDGTVSGALTCLFQSTFGSAEGNYASGWLEWGLFNSATAATGRMFDRVVQNNGVKASGSTWNPTITATLA